MIRVVTDSTAELAPDEIEELGITVIPLDTVLDGKTYRDRVTVSEPAFLDLMAASSDVPRSSLPSMGLLRDAYDRLGREGAKVVSIHLTGELSGTWNAARMAAQLSSADVTVVDSRFCARAHGFQVVRAAQLAKAGTSSVEEILARLDRVREATVQYFGVSQLGNLVKGGRITRVQGALSNLLRIKILLRMVEGSLVLDATSVGMRGFERSLHRALEAMALDAGPIEAVGITHTGLTACTRGVIERAGELFAGVPLHVSYASASIASHAGLGAVSLQFLRRTEG